MCLTCLLSCKDNEDLNGHIFLIEDGHFKDHVCYIGESVMFEE